MMMENPGQSIPKQAGNWAEAMGAYRFLSNPGIDPHALQEPHRQLTRATCAAHTTILAVTDITELNYSTHTKATGLGKLSNGAGRGLHQATTLAVSTDGDAIGVLGQHWYTRPSPPKRETRAQRQARWTEADVWPDAINALSGWGRGDQGCRCIHIFDRGGDCYSALDACRTQGHGFVIRAKSDRLVQESPLVRLWEYMASIPAACTETVEVAANRAKIKRDQRTPREATVSMRFGSVTFDPPVSDPRHKDSSPITVQVVYVREEAPPTGEGIEAIDWMLLTSEPLESIEDARRIRKYYAHRWIIEELHRVEKEGCRLEATQLDDAEDIKRLAAVTAVVAVGMLQLRDMAESAIAPSAEAEGPPAPADDPAVLRRLAPDVFIRAVAILAKANPATLTPRQFWQGIAKRGGWLGRKGDGRPGWKTVWQGWHEIRLIALGMELRETS